MISFIITSHNQIDYLRACLTALLWQTEKITYEVIIVDNNSDSQNPDTVYQEFYGRLPLYLVKQPKLEHPFANSRARNIGLAIAHYDWIMTLDSDILLPPHFFSALQTLLKGNPKCLITGERVFLDASNLKALTAQTPDWPEKQQRIESASNYYQIVDRRLEALRTIETSTQPWAYMHGCNMIYPRAAALAIKGYDERYDGHWGYEDVDFAYRIITKAGVAPAFNEQLYCYHLERPPTDTNDTQRFDKKQNPNWTRICQTIPGFKEFKEIEYKKISDKIEL